MRHPEGRVSLGEFGSVVVRRVRFGQMLGPRRPQRHLDRKPLGSLLRPSDQIPSCDFFEAPADTAYRHHDAAHLPVELTLRADRQAPAAALDRDIFRGLYRDPGKLENALWPPARSDSVKVA
jgi:hypothetical protein